MALSIDRPKHLRSQLMYRTSSSRPSSDFIDQNGILIKRVMAVVPPAQGRRYCKRTLASGQTKLLGMNMGICVNDWSELNVIKQVLTLLQAGKSSETKVLPGVNSSVLRNDRHLRRLSVIEKSQPLNSHPATSEANDLQRAAQLDAEVCLSHIACRQVYCIYRVSSHVKTIRKLVRACGLQLRHRFMFKVAARCCSDDRLVGKDQATL